MVEHIEPQGDDARVALEQQRGAQACPVCGHAMREHFIDHSTSSTVLNCPVSHPGNWDRDAFEPVNELGMVIHARQNPSSSTG